MTIAFEPNRSFCYKFARYTVLPEVQAMDEVMSGEAFRLTDLSQRVIDKYLTPEQQQLKLKKEQSEKVDPVHSIIKFLVAMIVKNQSVFMRLGQGVYRANTEDDFTQEELDEVALDEGDEGVSEYEGWIYAFSFAVLVVDHNPFPIKVGKTLINVDDRVKQQCKGSATFDNPVILGRWQVNRVGHTELAIHNVLKARGKWRENVPGTEWFNTTVAEVEAILKFVSGS
jgi:T5orf172 domain